MGKINLFIQRIQAPAAARSGRLLSGSHLVPLPLCFFGGASCGCRFALFWLYCLPLRHLNILYIAWCCVREEHPPAPPHTLIRQTCHWFAAGAPLGSDCFTTVGRTRRRRGSLSEDKSINYASSACLQLFYQSLKGLIQFSPTITHCYHPKEKKNVAPICVYTLS